MSQPVFTDPRSIVDFEAERAADKPTVTPLPAEAITREHRLCGKPFDGCYSHFAWMDHCRADGMAWPCDVTRLAILDAARAGSATLLREAALEVVAAYDERGVLGWHINRLRAALTTGTPGADR